MYRIITLAAATSLLALGACNRDTETSPAVADVTAEAAMPADSATSDASATASRSGSGAAAASGDAAKSESMSVASSSTTSPTGASVGPVTDETRRDAQAAAEATNLHPKPPGT